jgi:hypothetical protein
MAAGTTVLPTQFANRVERRDVVPTMLDAAPVAAVSERQDSVRRRRYLIGPAVAGGAVALAVGVYGRVHQPTGRRIVDLGFPSLLAMKSWLATIAVALALFQLLSALRLYGRLRIPRALPRWLPAAHRWSGTAAFLVSLPVAYHCLWSLGLVGDQGARPLVHGLLGCAFYGAMATKLLALRSRNLPAWALPVIGATLVTTLTALWLTSALWFFTSVDFPALPR